jgi:hypothetical protein
MSKMIPLHIADQAVAACEAEITTLKAKVERLKQAGDAMELLITYSAIYIDGPKGGLLKAWNNAKEDAR